MLRDMAPAFTRSFIAGIISLPVSVFALATPQDRSLSDLQDPLVHAEMLELGGYQELVMEFTTPTLREVPLFSHSPSHLEFRYDGLRVRIEAQPFEHPNWVKKSNGSWILEGQHILGWSPAETHLRLSRLEVVVDGCVALVPTGSWVDVFDAPLRRDDLLFASTMRSADGRRFYVHLQAGDAADARMVTWVFEDGTFLYRVVDPAP